MYAFYANFEGEKGVLVRRIDPQSFVADVKSSTGVTALGRNDLIQRVNRVPVSDLKSFNAIISQLKKGSPVVLHVARYDRQGEQIVPQIVQFTIQ